MFGNIFNQKKNDEQDKNAATQPAATSAQSQNQTPANSSATPQSSEPQPVNAEPSPQTPASTDGNTSQTPQATPTDGTVPAGAAPNGNGQSAPGQNPAVGSDMSALTHLDPLATQLLTRGQEETKRIHQQFIEPDQILIALLTDEHIDKLLEQFQVDPGALSKEVQAKETMGTYQGQPTLSPTSREIFEQAYKEAKMRGANFVTPEDVFIVLFDTKYSTAGYMKAHNLQKEAVVDKLTKSPDSNFAKKTVLEKYGIDLTEEARAGRLDPVAGRDKEIDRIVHVLLRRTKNNPIIIGEPGVGKTAIVEGLAQKIVSGEVPKDLQEKRIFQLDVASLVAGASHRGEFEERMRGVINEVLGSNNHIILFIDEIHALMGTGEGEGMNAANIIKPHLARGHFQLIGATTTIEYRKNFEKDKAFERRFQPVTAEEPSEENAFLMLKVLRSKYEKFHHVTVPDDILKECVKLSKKYIGERYLPDKAVDLLDEAASEVKLQLASGKRQDNQIKKGDVEKVVSAWTGIPITKLTEDESEKLLKLEDRIHHRLVDQEEAVVAVSEAVRRGRIGLAAANRPIASFVFLGPTGVGKTELAKTLAELLFGRDDAMARLHISEYMEKHEVAKLIGAPPGYVGYEEGGQLTEAVRKKPYSIVLLDEIEKAHPDVFNILLQLLEDGRLTDNKGNTISFRNTIVICTSNIGSSLIQQQLSQQDPKAKKTPEETTKIFKQLSANVKEELIKFFRPELLNRFDEVVIFKPLLPEHMAGIARLGIAKTAALLKEQGFNLQVTEKAIQQLATDGYDPVYGARPLRRLIQTAIENPIALAIISKKFKVGDTIIIDYNSMRNEFSFNKDAAALGITISDEQYKEIFIHIAKPDTVTSDALKQGYIAMNTQVLKAKEEKNIVVAAILTVSDATQVADVVKLHKDLETARDAGDLVAGDVLSFVISMAQQMQSAEHFKTAILEILNPDAEKDPVKKEQLIALHDEITKQNHQNDPLAVAIMAVSPTSSSDVINTLMNDLEKAKDQENELAMDVLGFVNSAVAKAAEDQRAANPVVKYKNVLKQIINPLYGASETNKAKYSVLYDKLSTAQHENNTWATSILSITDTTSDSDIEAIHDQLVAAKNSGDQLAGEVLASFDAAMAEENKQTDALANDQLAGQTPAALGDQQPTATVDPAGSPTTAPAGEQVVPQENVPGQLSSVQPDPVIPPAPSMTTPTANSQPVGMPTPPVFSQPVGSAMPTPPPPSFNTSYNGTGVAAAPAVQQSDNNAAWSWPRPAGQTVTNTVVDPQGEQIQ